MDRNKETEKFDFDNFIPHCKKTEKDNPTRCENYNPPKFKEVLQEWWHDFTSPYRALRRKIISFYQRHFTESGITTEDMWSFDIWHAKQVLAGLKHFKKMKRHGVPNKYYFENGENLEAAELAFEAALDDMIAKWSVLVQKNFEYEDATEEEIKAAYQALMENVSCLWD